MRRALFLMTSVLLAGCLGMPDGIEPVNNFEIEKYLGKWYEIARLDHKFERGLSHVSAEYTLRKDGKIEVLNRGYLEKSGVWKEAKGKASFAGENDQGFLKVSFFGPFYGSYIIFALDKENYEYAFVSGPDTSYLWLLARSPSPERKIIDLFLEQAAFLGFDTEALIYPKHG